MADWFDDAIAKDPFDPAALAARNRALPETDEDPMVTEIKRAVDAGMNKNWFSRMPRSIGIGAYKAALNMIKTGADIADAPSEVATEATGSSVDVRPLTIAGMFAANPALIPLAHVAFSKPFTDAADQFGDEMTANNTIGDDIVQGVAQFAIPFAGYLRAFGGIQAGATAMNVAKTAGAETAAVTTAFDPHDGRMADLLEMGRQSEGKFGDLLRKVSPDGSLVNSYINWMISREGEGEWEGRFKNAVDSLVATATLGSVLKAAGTSFKAVRQVAAEPMKVGPAAQRGSIGFENVQISEDKVMGTTSFTQHMVSPEGASVGRVNGAVNVRKEGPVFRIYNTSVDEGYRGKGLAVAAYERLVKQAQDRGALVYSDTEVSESAAHVYEALKRRGYNVMRDPSAVLEDGRWTADRGQPVFKITGKE